MKHLPDSSGRIEGTDLLYGYPVNVEFENGIITKVDRSEKTADEKNPVFIAPGLIDIQTNGYLSVSFSLEGTEEFGVTGKPEHELTVENVKKVTEALWKDGVTTYLPTLTTNRRDLLLKNLTALVKAKNDPYFFGTIPGFHLEGPYISQADGFRGAHPLKHVRKPDWDEFLEFYNTSEGKILLVTLAPEIDGALEFIRKCREKNIVIALGHHNGSAELIKKAIDIGARLSTHLGNGCAGQMNRHSNPIWPQLADDRLMISIIADGFHLPPEVLQVFYKAKGPENIILISDITSYAGLPAGRYKINSGETIEKTPDGNLRFSGQEGGLYGSALPLTMGIGHIMKVTGCSLAKAIGMTTINPAGLLNLNDRGSLERGKRADIILFTMDDFKMQILETIVEGRIVFQNQRI